MCCIHSNYSFSRLSTLQHENLSLRQQVDTAQHMANDRSGLDLQEKLNTMIGSLKSDHDKVCHTVALTSIICDLYK